jgi:iron complex outermembrane recepter protein
MVLTRFSSLLVILLVFMLVVAQAQTGPASQLTITVRDSSGGVIDGAILVLSMGTAERRETTGVDGTARFSGLESGQWTLQIRKEGFAISEQPVAVTTAPLAVPVTLDLPTINESVTVETRIGALDTTASSATRLELSLRELPATLNVVTQEVMQERGANTAMDAIEVAGGTFASSGLGGQLPGYQTRGFSGNSILQDGIRQNSAVQSSRPIDTFLLDRVEVLKGPASLLVGEGGLAGTVNYVSKMPRQQIGIDTLLSYGSFASRRIGLGITGPLGRNLMGRLDASYSNGGGFVPKADQKLRAMASSVWWTPLRNVTFKAQGRYTDDNIQAYYATPFIDGKPDPRMRYFNYNLQDAFSRGHNSFGRLDTDITLDNGWRIHNGTFAATQRLDYRNMESYSYNAATRKIDVSTYFLIWRDDILVGNQTDFRKTVDVLGRSVNFIAGVEFQRNDMHRAKNPLNSTTVRFSVDPFNPEPFFDPKLPYLRVPDVLVNNRTFYTEAQAKLARRWTTVAGLRWEQISVDYGLGIGDPRMGNRKFYPTTGRAGLVYTATEDVSIYGSYSRSVEPATQFIGLSGCCGTATFFELTPGRQFETGVKGTVWRGRLEGTAAFFDIQKENIPTRTIIDDVGTDQLVGRQISRGLEYSLTARPYSSFTLTADLSFTHGEFADFNEVVNNVNVSRNGNTPTNIPVVIWSVTPMQRFGPLTIAGSVRQVGERWADTANTRLLPSFTTLDTWVSIRLPRNTHLTLRGRNLTDEIYIPRASTTSGRISAPRSFEATITAGF